MKTFRIIGFLFAAFLAATGPALSQTPADDLADTAWLVTVRGEEKTRTLVIGDVVTKPGASSLEAAYGWTGGNMIPVKAEISQTASPRRLVLITPSNTAIVADERADGSFHGTFALKDGRVKGVVLTRANSTLRVAAAKPSAAAESVPLGVSHRADRPTYFVGDQWQFEFTNTRYAKPGCRYQLSVERITSSNVFARVSFPDGCDVSITTAYPIGQGTLQKFDLSLNHYHYSPDPYPAFDFPLYVGKTWTRKWQWKLNRWTYDDTVTATVEARETITTPAGTFDTYRIRLVRAYHGTKTAYSPETGTLTDTFWYSPQAKQFVKRIYDAGKWAYITRELVSYSVSDPAN